MKQPAKKKTSPKDKLAAGAAKIREAKAKAKAKPAKVAIVNEVFAPIEKANRPLAAIMADHVTVNADNTGVTIAKGIPNGEYLAVFDFFAHQAECSGFLLGDVINAAETVFGEKYAAALAATGRALSTLIGYATVAGRTPFAMRSKLTFSAHRELVKVPALEDRKTIIAEAVAAEKAGKPLTVRELREKADKFTPRKPKAKKAAKASKPKGEQPAPHELTPFEQAQYDAILDASAVIATALESADSRDLFLVIGKTDYQTKKALRINLAEAARWHGHLVTCEGYPS